MGTQALPQSKKNIPFLFDDFFRPGNRWFDNRGMSEQTINLPLANISEEKDEFQVSVVAPGLKKEELRIDVDGNMLTVSSEQEENKEEKDKKFTRKEYSYSSFSRSFTFSDEINKEKIDAKYENGVLRISLPRKEEAKKFTSKQIAVK